MVIPIYDNDPLERSRRAFTYMFLHGGWSHIIGNMLFLWVLGDNIEDAMGPLRYFFFYLLCGAAGGIAFLLSGPETVVPLVASIDRALRMSSESASAPS